jgi:excisionase family DNA binding protein
MAEPTPPREEERPHRLLSLDEVAERWLVSKRTVQRLVDANLLHSIRIGRQLRFRPEDVAAYESKVRW